MVAVDDSSVTLSWQPAASSHHAHHRTSADTDDNDDDDDDDGGGRGVVYELSYWRSAELNSSLSTLTSRTHNATVLALRPATRYCFKVRYHIHAVYLQSTLLHHHRHHHNDQPTNQQLY